MVTTDEEHELDEKAKQFIDELFERVSYMQERLDALPSGSANNIRAEHEQLLEWLGSYDHPYVKMKIESYRQSKIFI
jgi:hypothetical protein